MTEWDYIIVGAGSSGCSLAYELAKSGTARVLILEAGGKDSSIFVKIPAGIPRAIKRHDWGYVSEPDASRNGRTESWERGKVLGGSSSINGMLYVRGARDDFDRWESMGNPGWGYADVLPIFRDMECSDQNGRWRGRTGRLAVTTVKDAHRLTDAFLESAAACSIPVNPDYNGATQLGVSYAQLSQKNGFRCSAADAFLKPILNQSNIELALNAMVRKVHLEQGRATGVSYQCNGNLRTAHARHIILSAGAINSPVLLMRSGIGDAVELEGIGIGVELHSPQVGRNLREHPLIKLTFRTRIASNNPTEGFGQRVKIAWQYLSRRTGPIANLFEAAAFLSSDSDTSAPDIQLHFVPFGCAVARSSQERPLNVPSITIMVNASYPKSTGRIRLAGNDPDAGPLIECRLLQAESDLNTLERGVGVVRKIMSSTPIRELLLEEIFPGPKNTDESSLRTYIRNNTEIAYHPSGTCRMGSDDSVVTPDLRVRGVDNLWVADASIMPDLISGNTNAVCMMIGMKLGRYLTALKGT